MLYLIVKTCENTAKNLIFFGHRQKLSGSNHESLGHRQKLPGFLSTPTEVNFFFIFGHRQKLPGLW